MRKSAPRDSSVRPRHRELQAVFCEVLEELVVAERIPLRDDARRLRRGGRTDSVSITG
jgi:hypothetical protein